MAAKTPEKRPKTVKNSPFPYIQQDELQVPYLKDNKLTPLIINFQTGYEPVADKTTRKILDNQMLPFIDNENPNYSEKRARRATAKQFKIPEKYNNETLRRGVQFKFNLTKTTIIDVTKQEFPRLYFMTKYVCLKNLLLNPTEEDIHVMINMWVKCRNVLNEYYKNFSDEVHNDDEVYNDVDENSYEETQLEGIANAVITQKIFAKILSQNETIQQNLLLLLKMHLSPETDIAHKMAQLSVSDGAGASKDGASKKPEDASQYVDLRF